MFGGYISCLQFIAALVSANYRVRILVCESFDFDKVAVLEKLQHNEVLHTALSKCEYENISAKSDVLTISQEDAFVAYSFWTGITAHQLAQTIDKKFIFFIQEFETIFHPQDSFHAIGEYAYTLPHYAVFNTSILRDYFKQQKIGVFGGEKPDGDESDKVERRIPCYFDYTNDGILSFVNSLLETNYQSILFDENIRVFETKDCIC